MANYDGHITLATKVDTSGIKSDAKKIANQYEAATQAVAKQVKKVEEYRKRLAELESGVTPANDKGVAKIQAQFDKTTASIQKTESEIAALYEQLDALQSNAFRAPDAGEIVLTGKEQAQFDAINAKLDVLESKLEQNRTEAAELGDSLRQATGSATQKEIDSTKEKLAEAETKLKGMKIKAEETGKALKSKMSESNSALSPVITGFNKMGKKLTGMAKRVFIFSMITKALRGLRTTITSVIMSDDKFRESLRQLKAAFWTAFAPIYDFIIPALRNLIGYLTQAVTAAGKLMSKLTGMSYGDMMNKGESLSKQTAMYKGDKTAEEKSIEKQIKALEKKNKALNKEKKLKEKAQKAQEKANKRSLASFDEIDKLSFDKDNDELDALDDEIDKNDELIDQLQEQLDLIREQKEEKQSLTADFAGLRDAGTDINPMWTEILGTFEKIRDIFMSGFWEGFASADLSGLKNSITGIKDSLVEIAADPAVQQSATNLVNSFTKAFGQMTGALSSIGVTIADNLLGGFEYYLSQNKDRIKLQLTDIFNITADIFNIVGDWWVAVADIFSVLADENGKKLTGEIIGIFSDAFLGLTELALKLGKDFIDIFAGAIIDNKDGIKTALDGILKFFSDIAGDIHLVVQHLFDGLNKLYDEHIHPLMESMKKTWSDVAKHFVDNWNQHMQPVLDKLADKFHDVVEKHVNPMIDDVMELLGKLVDAVKGLWDNALSPLATDIVDDFVPIFASEFQMIGEAFTTLLSTASDVIGGISKALSGLIDFLEGTFTGNWEKALNGLKGIFKGVANAVISIIEGAVNLIVSAINMPLNAINSGMENMGLGSIPTLPELSIPRLATGAVLKPNNPFLAVVGDQKRGTNIEAPLSTIKKAVSDVINNGALSALKTVGTGLMSILSQVGQVLLNVGENITECLTEIAANQNNIVTLISNFFTSAAERFAESLGRGLSRFDFSGFFDEFRENFIAVLDSAFSNIQTQLYSVLGRLQQIQSGVQILVLAKTSYDEIRSILHEYFVGLYDCISMKTEYIASLLTDIKNAVSHDDEQSISGENGLTTTHDYKVTGAGVQYTNFYDNLLSRISEAVQSINLWLKSDLKEQISALSDGLGSINFTISAIGNGISSSTGIRMPRLATGAVIPPNREFLAVLGDQKSGTNIEAPLDTIKQAVAEVVGMTSRSSQPVILQVDGRELGRVTLNQTQREQRRIGVSLIE